jgi:hypothetical protein
MLGALTNRDSTRARCRNCHDIIELAPPVQGRPKWTWVHLPHGIVPCNLRATPEAGTISPADNPILAGPWEPGPHDEPAEAHEVPASTDEPSLMRYAMSDLSDDPSPV